MKSKYMPGETIEWTVEIKKTIKTKEVKNKPKKNK